MEVLPSSHGARDAPLHPALGPLDNAREMIKPILKRMGGARLYGSVTGKCHWGLVFLNYLLMRNRTIARLSTRRGLAAKPLYRGDQHLQCSLHFFALIPK